MYFEEVVDVIAFGVANAFEEFSGVDFVDGDQSGRSSTRRGTIGLGHMACRSRRECGR